MEADAAGFDHLTRGPVTLQVSQTLALDLTLQVGQQNATVNVVEAAPVTESQTSNVAQAVNRQMLAGLPLPNRAASSLAALAPGVVMIDPGTGHRRKLSRFQRGRRPGAQSELSRWTAAMYPTRWA